MEKIIIRYVSGIIKYYKLYKFNLCNCVLLNMLRFCILEVIYIFDLKEGGG